MAKKIKNTKDSRKPKKKLESKKNQTIKKHIFGMTDKDFSKKNFIEGGVIRPIILMISFLTFLMAIFLILIGASTHDEYLMKWGGSLIIISFIFNLYSIFQSLTDKESIFRSFNLGFKFILFAIEIIGFNWILTLI